MSAIPASSTCHNRLLVTFCHFCLQRCTHVVSFIRTVETCSCEEPTFQFAAEFAAQSADLQDVLEMEREAEEIRINEHWNQVQEQQDEAQRLRIVIADLQQQLTDKEAELHHVRSMEQYLGSIWTQVCDHVRTHWCVGGQLGPLQFCVQCSLLHVIYCILIILIS